MTTADPALPAPALTRTILVLGGARSGKSAFAEGLLRDHAQPLYVATAEPGDPEMAERIRRHRARRGGAWRTEEVPLALPEMLDREPAAAVLVDCLTLWLSNLIHAGRDIRAESARLRQALSRRRSVAILVSNEVGLGIVPDNALARRFRDEAGRLNQQVAEVADRVVFLAAGLPLILKGSPV